MLFTYIFYVLDLFSTVVFAASGALIACEQRENVFCALFYAALTAVGGGTLRDLLLGQPVFWLRSPLYLFLSLAVGLCVAIWVNLIGPHRRYLDRLWLGDAIGLAVFTVIGAQAAMQIQAFESNALLFWLLPPLMGWVTGIGGGLMRDLLRRKRPHAVRYPAYAIASLVGGSLYSLLLRPPVAAPVAVGVAIAAVLLISLVLNPAVSAAFRRGSFCRGSFHGGSFHRGRRIRYWPDLKTPLMR